MDDIGPERSPRNQPLSPDYASSHRPLPLPIYSPIVSDRLPDEGASPGCKCAGPSPSPAGKRFPGVSSNARNNIYMKTLMNSPYHKSYTPLSATPGPSYTTPVRVLRSDKHEGPIPSTGTQSPKPHPVSTPQGSRPPVAPRKYATPKNLVNPFDPGVDDLHLPAYMSPGFFSVTSTPASGPVHEEMMQDLQGSIQKSLPPKQGTVDATCQTVLSLPVNFDLGAILGAYMTGESENGNQEMLSTSSLRRKLFFHGDTSSLAPSPVKSVAGEIGGVPDSPLFSKQQPNWDHVTPLKNTPAFSSSPIKSAGTPQHRRCSSDPEFLASPELSPIVHGNMHKSSGRRSRSSGMFEVHQQIDFDAVSPVSGDDAPQGPHSPMSPIPFGSLSPEENLGEELRPKFEDSPGFSPIRPPKTPIRKILRKSQEESYIQDDACDSDVDEESVTPVSAYPGSTHTVSISLTPVEHLSPIHGPSTVYRNTNTITKSHSCTDLQTRMDFEAGGAPRENILTSSLCDTRDFTVSFRDDTHQQTSLYNQDTGYQTASLQSTNPESVSLHTNLTNQFGSLPFNLTNQESAFQNLSHIAANQDKPPVMSLASHLSRISGHDSDDDGNNSNNNGRSSPLFPTKQKLLFMDDELDLQDTPKNIIPTRLQFDDSALPDEFDSRQMEVDSSKLTGLDCVVTSQEEVVLSRARETLAMANSLYPQTKLTSSLSASVQQRLPPVYMSKVSHEDRPGKEKMSASELAFSIIQRAGEDLAKYGSMIRDNKTQEMTMEDKYEPESNLI
ncbi:hypothetical protein MAR_008990 [Mya arenaria]|uniref:Protein aurora borealis n=1 Tax=Mya arenaria TaxID=6604 RepID=A0ABY7E0A2_MYAAR|nr:hypothetical protein MAR_008990 [Mya arenaria]